MDRSVRATLRFDPALRVRDSSGTQRHREKQHYRFWHEMQNGVEGLEIGNSVLPKSGVLLHGSLVGTQRGESLILFFKDRCCRLRTTRLGNLLDRQLNLVVE
jgi:hypothetical protein